MKAESTMWSQWMLDPFLGSGTTVFAAMRITRLKQICTCKNGR